NNMGGRIIINILFGTALLATFSYFLSERNKSIFIKRLARLSFYIVFGGLIFISGYFLYLIMSHDFQYTYILNYTSTELPGYLLVSAFFAGQEGSFLLWALLFSTLGVFLIPYAKEKEYESIAMGFFSLILAFLMLMLIVKSPFKYIWESFPDVAQGFTPSQGRGLNPILENFWIIIHPPILFIGYAAMSVPYIFSVSALIKKDYSSWIDIAIPWTLTATGFLGLGIGLGAYWAYETLGWGGFWGWDPVENSSLLPWLVSMAFVHTMLIQKKTGGLKKTNFLLGILSFILVLYATFLTRSGILSDMSVHSFVDPGSVVYAILLIFTLLFLLIGMYMLIVRMKDLNKDKQNFSLGSRETFVTLGSIMLLISTAIVFIGTSFPIFLELTGQAKTTVEISFYDKWNLPIAVLLLLLCGFSFALNWKSNKINFNIKQLLIPVLVSLLVTALIFVSGVDQIKHLLLAFGSVYCLYVSVFNIMRIIGNKPKQLGSYLSHAGVGIFFIGVLFSGGYTTSTSLMLATGETKEALGYTFTYLGSDRIEKDKKDREKYKCNIKIEKDEDFSLVSPIVYWSDFNEKQAPFFEPGIQSYLTQDLYISPKALSYQNDIPSIVLKKNQSAALPYDSSYTITLSGFDMSRGMSSNSDKNEFIFGGIVDFKKDGNDFTDTLYINLDMSSGKSTPIWYELESTDIKIGFDDFNVDANDMSQSQAVFSVTKNDVEYRESKEVFTFEISIKPFIIFVWLGSIALISGFFIALFKNRKIFN
ncbi:heme lyase CcmF/NrfE family subunit, partial [Bacteroidota bacterium]